MPVLSTSDTLWQQAGLERNAYLNVISLTAILGTQHYLFWREKIEFPWQLQALFSSFDDMSIFLNPEFQSSGEATPAHYAAMSGNLLALKWIKQHLPENLMKKDWSGNTIIHYAARSGNIATLDWIKKDHPQSLNDINYNGITIAHCAALSGNPAMLDWIKMHMSERLSDRDTYDLNICHYAILSNNIAMLNWIKQHMSELLREHSASARYGIAHLAVRLDNPAILDWIKQHAPARLNDKIFGKDNIAHHTASSNQPKILRWIKASIPTLLYQEDNNGYTYIHRIALECPRHFSYALAFITTFFIPKKDFRGYLKNNLNGVLAEALATNYDLLTIPGIKRLDSGQQALIEGYLKRNQDFKQAITNFTVLLQGNGQVGHFLHGLDVNTLRNIFERLVSAGIESRVISKQFSKMMAVKNQGTYYRKPYQLAKCALQQRISALRQPSLLQKITLSLSGQRKIDALTSLLALVNQGTINHEALRAWYNNHYSVINKQRNRFHAFFEPNHLTATRIMINELFKLLNIDIPTDFIPASQTLLR